MKIEKPSFWVTNLSNRNVSLSDLNLTIKSFTTVNLMDTRHYQYTVEQLQKSAAAGSLFRKRDKLVVRKVAPPLPKKDERPIDRGTAIPSRERSILVINEEKYDELQVSDEEFASENAATAEMDAQPLVIKNK